MPLDIVQLLPDQVSALWAPQDGSIGLAYCIEQSLPPTSNRNYSLNTILHRILTGHMECWLGSDFTAEQKLVGVMTTAVIEDPLAGTPNLVLYTLYTFTVFSREFWTKGTKLLLDYARRRGCERLVFYTNVDYVKRVAKKLGADVSWTYGQVEVPQ